jgi:hypothetical protein
VRDIVLNAVWEADEGHQDSLGVELAQVLPIDLSEHILARSKRRSKNPSVKRPIRSVAPE